MITSATNTANGLLSRHQGETLSRSQILEAHQIHKLSLTLNRKDLYSNLSVVSTLLMEDTPISPCYHLVYFTLVAFEEELGIAPSRYGESIV